MLLQNCAACNVGSIGTRRGPKPRLGAGRTRVTANRDLTTGKPPIAARAERFALRSRLGKLGIPTRMRNRERSIPAQVKRRAVEFVVT